MRLRAGEETVKRIDGLAVRSVIGIAGVAGSVTDDEGIFGGGCGRRGAVRQASQQELQHQRAGYREADQRPRDPTLRLLMSNHTRALWNDLNTLSLYMR